MNQTAELARAMNELKRHLRASLIGHLEVLHLVAKHAGPQRASEAENALSRHTSITYRCGCDEGEGKPEADWNRVGDSAFGSLEHLERCVAAVNVAEQVLLRKNVSRVLRRP